MLKIQQLASVILLAWLPVGAAHGGDSGDTEYVKARARAQREFDRSVSHAFRTGHPLSPAEVKALQESTFSEASKAYEKEVAGNLLAMHKIGVKMLNDAIERGRANLLGTQKAPLAKETGSPSATKPLAETASGDYELAKPAKSLSIKKDSEPSGPVEAGSAQSVSFHSHPTEKKPQQSSGPLGLTTVTRAPAGETESTAPSAEIKSGGAEMVSFGTAAPTAPLKTAK